jgi:hypothetical protein
MEGEKDENYLRNVGKSLLGNFPFQECGGARTGLLAVRYPTCFLVFTGQSSGNEELPRSLAGENEGLFRARGENGC